MIELVFYGRRKVIHFSIYILKDFIIQGKPFSYVLIYSSLF